MLVARMLSARAHRQETRIGHLVQAIAPASARHGAAGELVHDDDLRAAHDVVDVLGLQLLCLEGIDEVGCPLLSRVVQVCHLPHTSSSAPMKNPGNVGLLPASTIVSTDQSSTHLLASSHRTQACLQPCPEPGVICLSTPCGGEGYLQDVLCGLVALLCDEDALLLLVDRVVEVPLQGVGQLGCLHVPL